MKNIRVLFILAFLLGALSIISLFLGSPSSSVVLRLRLPRLILAIFAGGALSIVGSAFQSLLRNPLADPYILGISGGACIGAAFSLITGYGPVQVYAFVSALITIFIVAKLATVCGRLERETLLLAGVVCGTLAVSLVMLFMTIGGKDLSEMVYLLMGWLGVIWDRSLLLGFIISLILVLLASIFIWLRSKELNILSIGEEEASSVGVDVERLKREIFISGSIIIGLVVSFCGAIGFIGLVVPHIVRRLVGPNHRVLIPYSAMGGAALLLISDTVARNIALYELPVGIITSIFGVPFFLYLLRRR